MTKNGTTYYYHVNGHGDVVALTDGSGNTVAQYSYDAWGNIISQSGTIASENPLRYAGYRYDEATGLYYLMARYYDPNIGCFITRDTFHGYEDEPLSLNQYAYAKGNPVIYVDPSGHAAAAGLFILGQAIVDAVAISIGLYNINNKQFYFSKGGKQKVTDTGLSHLTDEEINRLAKDKSLSGKERQRYIKEQKARKIRNKAKRTR